MTLRHHLVSKPIWTLAGLAIALVGCVTLKPNEQGSSTSNAGGRDGEADDDASEAGATGAEGGKGGSGAGVGGNAGGSDRLDASDGADDLAPDAEGASDGEDTADGEGASDGPVTEPCVDTCDSSGTFGCSPAGVVQACSSSGRCLAWRDIGPCPDEHVCCSGFCVKDEGVVSPTCSNPTPDGYDLYVDASAVENAVAGAADGSRAHPFRTITRALQAVGRDGEPPATRIYVARGRYDENLGEAFPLVVPGGVTLDGAGAVRTTIAGLRHFNPMSRSSAPGADLFLTMALGDKKLPTRVTGFTVVPGEAVRIPNYVGILCDRGTPAVTNAGENGPNTTLSDLVIGPGYDKGIWATGAAPGEPACNLRLRASTILGGKVGLYTSCDDPVSPSNIEVGDGTEAGGNTFRSQVLEEEGNGVGLNLACVTRFDVSYNTFVLGNGGIYINTRLYGPPNVEQGKLRHNKFDRLDWKGVAIWGSGISLDEFTDNEFTDVSMFRQLGYQRGMAIALEVHGAGDFFFPLVYRARRNRFYRCDTAISFAHDGTFLPSMWIGDFGSLTDPGNNTFHCNGRYARHGGPTSIFFDFSNVPMPVGFVLFQGNFWDTTAPNAVTTDLYGPLLPSLTWPAAEVLRRSDNVTLNYAGAKLATPNGANACPP